jgi:hypothetical protein
MWDVTYVVRLKSTDVSEEYVTSILRFEEEIKRTLNSCNACYHSVQNRLSSPLLSRNIKIRIYKTIILPVVQYGCELGL